MNIQTKYLGMILRSPLVASASPLSQTIDNIKRLEEAGAGAVVLYSLFEEQIRHERNMMHLHMLYGTESHAEALTYFPEPAHYTVGPDGYLDYIYKVKDAVNIPIIASLNGASLGGWTQVAKRIELANFAKRMEIAGADALELNIYFVPTDLQVSGEEIENGYLDIVRAVRQAIQIPLAVKISPYFSSTAHMAHQIEKAGANALVMFNRFYQPDIDLDALEVRPNVMLSTTEALRLPLRWIAILYKRIAVDFAATGGVYTGEDAIKLILAGANVTMMASALLKHGIDHLSVVEQQMRDWMERHEYNSVEQMRGALSQVHCDDPAAFERAQYMRALTQYGNPS
jgi:dihydroorotate dehydrogenase (fumarate)